MKPTLADAANTMVPAYLVLLHRGLLVSRDSSFMTHSGGSWVAEDSGHRFVAEDLVTLLGLVALYETRGPDWQASDEQIDQFISEFGVP